MSSPFIVSCTSSKSVPFPLPFLFPFPISNFFASSSIFALSKMTLLLFRSFSTCLVFSSCISLVIGKSQTKYTARAKKKPGTGPIRNFIVFMTSSGCTSGRSIAFSASPPLQVDRGGT